MPAKYIQAAMKRAEYEVLNDNTFYGSIPGLEGVWANEPTWKPAAQSLRTP